MSRLDKERIARDDAVSMRTAEREAEIKRLERERKRVNGEIEILLREYAKAIGDKTLRPRKPKKASRPNDYDYGKKI